MNHALADGVISDLHNDIILGDNHKEDVILRKVHLVKVFLSHQ